MTMNNFMSFIKRKRLGIVTAMMIVANRVILAKDNKEKQRLISKYEKLQQIQRDLLH